MGGFPGNETGGYDWLNIHMHGFEVVPHLFHPMGTPGTVWAPFRTFFSAEDPEKTPQDIRIPKLSKKMLFWKHGRWEALDCCKILPRGVGTIRRPGQHHSGQKKVLTFFRLSKLCQGNSGPAPGNDKLIRTAD